MGISHTIFAQNEYELIDVVVMRDQPIVQGKMNGKTAYFLLDTGSDVTLLNTGDAKRYGYAYHTRRDLRGYRLAGLGKSTNEVLGIYNVDLRLGSQKIKDIFIAYDLSNIIRSLNAGSSIKINGIIGAKALRRHGFVIDYDLNEVKMKRP
jgi:hypothetical protein